MSQQKVAIVTGANKGLGFAVVKQLCKEYPGKVYLTSRDAARGLQACENLRQSGLNPTYHQLDVSEETSLKTFVKHIETTNERVDILINNAGIFFNTTEVKDQPELTMQVNFYALVNFTEALLPFMTEGSKIVNVSSSSGHLSRIPSDELKQKFLGIESLDELIKLMDSYVNAVKNGDLSGWGNSSYVVSKVGVNCYTFLLDRRLGDKGITVNSVHPGYVMTAMTAGRGNVSATDAAGLVVGLALRPRCRGRYVWSDGAEVPWGGRDPRAWKDGKDV